MRKEIAEYIERRDGYPSSPDVRPFNFSSWLTPLYVSVVWGMLPLPLKRLLFLSSKCIPVWRSNSS